VTVPRTLRRVAVVVVAFGGALVPLLLLDGDRRAFGFRAYGLLLGLLALRAILGFSVDAGVAPVDSPFHEPRRLPPAVRRRLRRGRDAAARHTPTDHLAAGAVHQASAFHYRLRPVLRDVADERLQARHGIGIDDPRARELLGPVAHDHLRADRPEPADRRAPGVDAETLHAILTTVESL
jgi:hypothetical protein